MKSAKFMNIYQDNTFCLISGKKFTNIDFEENNIVKLKCGHTFDYKNIYDSYKITNLKSRNYMTKQLCPYCLQKGGLLPPKNNYQYIKGVNFKGKKKDDLNNYLNCCAEIKNGANKGKICGNKCKITFLTLYQKPFYILDVELTENIINFEFKPKIWCGKHETQCKQFIKNSCLLHNYHNTNKDFVKICYRSKFGYIYCTIDTIIKVEYLVNSILSEDNKYKFLKLFINNKEKIVDFNRILKSIKTSELGSKNLIIKNMFKKFRC